MPQDRLPAASKVFAGLPPAIPDDDGLRELIRAMRAADGLLLGVLDDDPTGSQAVHGVQVVTVLEEDAYQAAFGAAPVCFVLTNTRSLAEPAAAERNTLAARGLIAVAARRGARLCGAGPLRCPALHQPCPGPRPRRCGQPGHCPRGLRGPVPDRPAGDARPARLGHRQPNSNSVAISVTDAEFFDGMRFAGTGWPGTHGPWLVSLALSGCALEDGFEAVEPSWARLPRTALEFTAGGASLRGAGRRLEPCHRRVVLETGDVERWSAACKG